jgi:hypothetical protein
MADKHSTAITPIDRKTNRFSYIATRTNIADPTRDCEVAGDVQINAEFGKAELQAHILEQFAAIDLQRPKDVIADAELTTLVETWQTDIDTYLDNGGA